MAKTLFIQCSSVGLSTENYFNLFYTIGGSSTLIPAVDNYGASVSPLSAGQLIAGVTIVTPDNVDQIVVNSPVGPCKDTYNYALAPGVSPSLTPSATKTPSVTPTATPTPTVTKTASVTPTISITASITPTPSVTPTISTTASPSISPSISTTASISATPSVTPTISTTASISATPSVTPTISITATVTPSISTTASPSISPTISTTASISTTPSVTPTISTTATLSITPTISTTASPTISASPSVTPSTSAVGVQFGTFTTGAFGAAPTPYLDSTTACRQSDTLTGQVLYQKPADGSTPNPTAQLYTDVACTAAWNPAIAGNRWFKVGRSSTYWAIEVSIGGVIQTVTDCSTIPSTTPSPSITVSPSVTPTISTTASISRTPSVTPSTSAVGIQFGTFTEGSPGSAPTGFVTSIIACQQSNTLTGQNLYQKPTDGTTPTVSAQLYTDVACTAVWNPGIGSNAWFKLGRLSTYWGVEVSIGGVIQNVVDCSTIISTTPSATITPTPSITPTISTTASVSRTPSVTPSNSAVGFQFGTFTTGAPGSAPTDYGDSTTACRQSDTLTGQNLYQLPADGGTPLVGAQLYINNSCTSTWAPAIAGSRWFKLGRSSTYWAVLVSIGGVVQTVTDCTTIPSNTPSATVTQTPSISTTATLSPTPSISTTATLSVTPTISTTASVSATPSITPSTSTVGVQFGTYTAGAPGSAPTDYGDSTTACRQSDTLTGQVLYQKPADGTIPTVAAQLYTNVSCTTAWAPAIGSARWFKLGRSSVYWAVQVNVSGVIAAVTDCTTIPSNTPSATVTPTPSITPTISTTASISPTPTISTTATLSVTPSISTTASVSRTPSVTPSNSALGFQFGTFTAGGAGSAPTAYTDSTNACRQSDTLIGQNLYQKPADGGTPLVTAQLYTNISCTTAWAPSIPGNRWFKLGRSGVYWAVEVNTSGVVQTVTACTAIPSNTPSATMTPTPTVTTPATIFSRSSTDYANEYFACLGSVSGIDFLYQTPGAGGGTTPAVSAQMYTNPGLTTTWTPGGSGWYLLSYGAVTYAVLPNASGVLQTVYTCSTLPSQTPTPTRTPSVTPTPTSPGVAFGKSTTTYATTNLACSGTITGTIYQPPAYGTTPTVSVQLYTNSNLTTTWTPPSTSGYYLFQYGGSTKWAVGVGSSGIISSVVDCSAVPSLTPTPTPTPTISTTASVSRTPSTTPSNSQAASGFGAVGGYGNFTDACRGGAPTFTIYTAPGTTVPIATTVFYNSATLASGTEFNGNGNWFKLIKGASTYAAQISTSGVVTDYRDCSTIPSNSPTPSPTATPAAGYDFYNATDYACVDCSNQGPIVVAFPAGSSVTLNRWYTWSAGGSTDSFRILSSTTNPGGAVPLLFSSDGPYTSCLLACPPA